MLPNHYEVLALPSSPEVRHSNSQEDIKLAYRRALLQHHPDKSPAPSSRQPTKPKYTIDDITTAYKILSDPSTRAEFDRQLRLLTSHSAQPAAKPLSGLETIDLDDLEFDSAKNVWYRLCRCGNDKGYLITEDDLEKEAEHGEIITGCGGCSLWLKVVFQRADEA
ncbi:Diphthamide biosynthesis protein 4 [Trapelia coarctata]|nr:Diphthamide biosynthesis protein 4 [Trapelia coarctata]